MKIGIIATDYSPGQMGGIESYFLDLIENLQLFDYENEYYLFLNQEGFSKINVVAKTFNKVLVRSGMFSKIIFRIYNKIFKKNTLANMINKHNFDLVHFPFQVIKPQGIKTKKVISIMDIQHEFYPEFFSKPDLISRARTFPYAAKNANKIIAISEFTKKSLNKIYKVPLSKIDVVHLSHNSRLFNKNSTIDSKLRRALPNKYFYYPAASWPHKNHKLLIEAFMIFSKKNPSCKLVLTGISKQNENELSDLIKSLGMKDKITKLGYVSRDSLPTLYKGAVSLVFPSLFEGFGIPPLEAMAVGCPVICSNGSSLPEIVGEAGLYFNPNNANDIADKMDIIFSNNKLRKALIKKGYIRANIFSNKKMALETVQVYKEAIHEK